MGTTAGTNAGMRYPMQTVVTLTDPELHELFAGRVPPSLIERLPHPLRNKLLLPIGARPRQT